MVDIGEIVERLRYAGRVARDRSFAILSEKPEDYIHAINAAGVAIGYFEAADVVEMFVKDFEKVSKGGEL